MKLRISLFVLLAVGLGFAQSGCASRQKKSTSHTYVGDSPTIKYGARESAGGLLLEH